MNSNIEGPTERHQTVSDELTKPSTTVSAHSIQHIDSLPPNFRYAEQSPHNKHPAQDSSTTLAPTNDLILPAELWIIIFSIVSDDVYATDLRNFDRWKSLFILIQVCRGWYSIIQKTPSFWAFLDSKLSLKANQRLVEKSGSYPLAVTGCQLTRDFSDLLNSQLHRVISITFTPDDIALLYYPNRVKLHQAVPILAELSIKTIGISSRWRPSYINLIIAPRLKVFEVQGLFVHFEHIPQQKSLTRLSTMMGEAELSAAAYSLYVERLSTLRHLEELELSGWPLLGRVGSLPYKAPVEIHLPFLRRFRLCMTEPDITLLLLNSITSTPDDISLELDWHREPELERYRHPSLWDDHHNLTFINKLFAKGTLAHTVWQRVMTLHLLDFGGERPHFPDDILLRGWHVDTHESNPHLKANISLVIGSYVMDPMLHNMDFSNIKSLHVLHPCIPPLSFFPSLEYLSVRWWPGPEHFLFQLAPTLPSDQELCPRLRTLRVYGKNPSLSLLLHIVTCRQMHRANNKVEGSASTGLERLEIGTDANEGDENVVSTLKLLKERLGVEGVQLSKYSDPVQ
ncbi:hypothetical protein FRC02_009185 [Tulasnella sp. 418]|nr:hypothetical protein FRC02_009185 [Tulasnella sp. 418]